MYIKTSDLEDVIPEEEFLELFDRDHDDAADADVVGNAINAAVSQVHGKLARRYGLPLNEADAILMAFIRPGLLDLAWAAGHPRADMVSDALQARCDAFVKRLDDIMAGKADLPASAPPPAAPGGSSFAPSYSAHARKTKGGLP